MAATTDRDPFTTHDAVRSGLVTNRVPTATGATSARTPSRRITLKGYVAERFPDGAGGTSERPAGSTASRLGRGVVRRRLRGPRPALLYSGRPRNERAGPANQEVNDRACMAHRPSREASERPDDGDPPKRRRRETGESIRAPGPTGLGLLVASCVRPPALARCAALVALRRGAALMPATVIVGLQWGDEGKGKTTDFLAEQVAMVVRYQGGDNAGHTVVSGDEVFKLRLTPSGVLYPHITSVIGNGVVVNPVTLIAELDMLTARGIDVSRVRVSRSAHVIMPYHVALDVANEARLADAKVGTTGRGIGPTYGDRAWRLGLRMEDLLDRDVLRERIGRVASRQEPACSRAWAARRSRSTRSSTQALALGRAPARPPRRHDLARPGARSLRGEHVLLEGAQGTLLDLDHGSYPFVTSSNPVAGGACTGGGIGPLQVDEVIGVMKAYSTRVGSGPYPTELHDEIGAGIAERGHEFGTVTGRPRRVGWFDAVPLRYAVAVNSVSSIMLNKLDILSGIDTIRAVRRLRARRAAGRDLAVERRRAVARATPIYDEFPGWAEPIHDVRSLADLPENARRYVSAIEEHAGVPIVLVSVGPERTQTIERAWRPMRHRRGAAGMSLDHADPHPHRRAAAGASTRWPGSWPPSRASTRSSSRPGATRSRWSRGCAASPASTRSIRPRSWRVARREASELVVIGPEAPLAAGVADALIERGLRRLRPDRGGGPDRGEQGVLPRGRRRGRRADGAAPRRSRDAAAAVAFAASWPRPDAASWSRRTGWRPARA